MLSFSSARYLPSATARARALLSASLPPAACRAGARPAAAPPARRPGPGARDARARAERRERFDRRRRELGERRESRRGGDRVAVVGATVGQRPTAPLVEERHDVLAATECRQCVAAANDLAQCREVRTNAGTALRAAMPDAERDDLVEDQQRPDPRRDVAEECQESLIRRPDAAGALHWLDDDRGKVALTATDRALDTVNVA